MWKGGGLGEQVWTEVYKQKREEAKDEESDW